MGLVEQVYEAAANAGLLNECIWHPSDGSAPQTERVGFAAPDETLLDGLSLSTEYVILYPASVFKRLAVRDTVEIGEAVFQVRYVRAVGDGSEKRATLTKA